MAAYGLIHDAQGPVAFVRNGCIYRESGEGELIGYVQDNRVLDLQHNFVGQLQPVGAGTGTSAIRQLLEEKA